MENHHCSWENSLFLWPCSIAMSAITRGYPDAVPMVWMMSRKKMLVAGWIPQRRLMCSPCLDVKGWLNGILGAFFWLWDYGDFMVILSEYIYIYVSISLSISISISISISPSIHLSIHPSIHLSIYLSICIYIYIYVCPREMQAFPWLLNNSSLDPWLPLDVPRDILYDGARVAALLDIRQMIGARTRCTES